MKPEVRVELEGMDPIFEPGSSHVAHASMHNPTSATFSYDGELYLGEKQATSGPVSFTLTPGQTKPVDFGIVMPSAEATYKVYLDVYVAGDLIAAYVATQDVTIEVGPAIDVGPITWD